MLVSMLVNLSHHCTSAIPPWRFRASSTLCVEPALQRMCPCAEPSDCQAKALSSAREWFRMQHTRAHWVCGCLHATLIRLPMHANLRMHAVRLITCMQDVNSTKAIAKSLESAINGHLESAVDVLRYEQCLIARALCQNPRLPGSLAAAIVAMDRNQFHEASLIQ